MYHSLRETVCNSTFTIIASPRVLANIFHGGRYRRPFPRTVSITVTSSASGASAARRHDIAVVNYTRGTHPVSGLADTEIITRKSPPSGRKKCRYRASPRYIASRRRVLEERATVSLALGYPTIPPEMATNYDVTLVSPRQIFNSAAPGKTGYCQCSCLRPGPPPPPSLLRNPDRPAVPHARHARPRHNPEGDLDVDAAVGKSYFDEELIRCIRSVGK